MEAIITVVWPWVLGLIGAVVGGSILKWLLDKIPTEKIEKAFGAFMYGLGVTITLGLAKWKYTKKVWNAVIEPWVIVFLEGLVSYGLSQFINGLKSDNPVSEKKK